jgi:mRNA-degrading endonuclease RelE of RelBE toxin-antitoxin system
MMAKKSISVVFLSEFDNNMERFIRKKKFKKLPVQIKELETQLLKGEIPGTPISKKDDPEPHEVYKLRLPNPDVNAGKRDGYRIYYFIVTEWRIVVFATVYYKKEQPTVSDAHINGLIDGFFIDTMPFDDSEDDDAFDVALFDSTTDV